MPPHDESMGQKKPPENDEHHFKEANFTNKKRPP
jgi:hypothetical protein